MKRLFVIIFAGLACFRSHAQDFEISGSVSGFKDHTLLYLDDLSVNPAVHVDSVRIQKGRFTIRGKLISPTMRLMLRTPDFSDYKYFWIEKNPLSFVASKGKFREAGITGSKTQDEETLLSAQLKKAKGENEEKRTNIQFIRNHPNSFVSANLLKVYASTWGRDTAKVLYDLLSNEMQQTPYGSEINEFVLLNKDVKIGDRFTDIIQPDQFGNEKKLSDYSGKYILLEFWGSWCGPCREAHPELVKTYNQFKSKNFEIFGVAADTKRENWVDAIEKDKMTWSNVSDLRGDNNRAALIYGISYYPANFLINPEGIIIARDLHGKSLDDKLKELLK